MGAGCGGDVFQLAEEGLVLLVKCGEGVLVVTEDGWLRGRGEFRRRGGEAVLFEGIGGVGERGEARVAVGRRCAGEAGEIEEAGVGVVEAVAEEFGGSGGWKGELGREDPLEEGVLVVEEEIEKLRGGGECAGFKDCGGEGRSGVGEDDELAGGPQRREGGLEDEGLRERRQGRAAGGVEFGGEFEDEAGGGGGVMERVDAGEVGMGFHLSAEKEGFGEEAFGDGVGVPAFEGGLADVAGVVALEGDGEEVFGPEKEAGESVCGADFWGCDGRRFAVESSEGAEGERGPEGIEFGLGGEGSGVVEFEVG